ncbi:uncharacterized protein LOC135350576 isoform X2 [Halichondria panicea]|uniref:uncharacterized protein LOC135350576 isoform X2 n=1 Tax=Halichondria panicea TaxID=6063 RepID=UPI00312BA4D5
MATTSLLHSRGSTAPPSLRAISTKKHMSFNSWSRHEPITATHTDHWSKLRTKSYKLRKLPSGNVMAFCDDKDSNWLQSQARQEFGLPRSTAVTPQGTLAPVGSAEFNQYLVERLHNPHIVYPRPPSDSRGYEKRVRVPSASNQRAKRGYKYWVDDKKQRLSSPSRRGYIITS